jgi:hypothetical protein
MPWYIRMLCSDLHREIGSVGSSFGERFRKRR